MADSSRKSQIYRFVGVRSDPAACGGSAFYVYLVRLVLHVDWGHGGGWRVGAKNEGRMERLTRKWRILVVKSKIYSSSGIRSDPVALRWFRIILVVRYVLELHVDLGHGGGRWVGAKNEGRLE